MAEKKKRKWLRRTIWTLSVLVVLVVALLVAAKFWVVPAVLRMVLPDALSDYWDGTIEVGDIEFNYTGPTVLRDIRLLDHKGRQWAHVRTLQAVLKDWPGIHPVLSGINVDQLNFDFHFEPDGTCHTPFLSGPEEPTPPNPYVDIQSVTIGNAAIAAVDDKGERYTWAGISLKLTCPENAYELHLYRRSPDNSDRLSLDGTINPDTMLADLTLSVLHTIDEFESGLLLRCVEAPWARQIIGTLQADMVLKGRLDDPNIWPDGKAKLENWSIDGEYGALARKLHVDVKLTSAEHAARFENFSTDTFDGTVRGKAELASGEKGAIRFDGHIEAEGIRMATLTKNLTGEVKIHQGVVALKYYATAGDTANLDDLRGGGWVFFDDATVLELPLFAELFKVLTLSPKGLTQSDLEAWFRSEGLCIVIDKARLANALAALDVEQGGTINLKTTELNMYMVAVPLTALQHVPVVNWVVNLQGNLTRLHVFGSWNQPPAELVSIKPLGNVAAGVTDFFKDVSRSGGQLVRPIEDIDRDLERDRRRNREKEESTTKPATN